MYFSGRFHSLGHKEDNQEPFDTAKTVPTIRHYSQDQNYWRITNFARQSAQKARKYVFRLL